MRLCVSNSWWELFWCTMCKTSPICVHRQSVVSCKFVLATCCFLVSVPPHVLKYVHQSVQRCHRCCRGLQSKRLLSNDTRESERSDSQWESSHENNVSYRKKKRDGLLVGERCLRPELRRVRTSIQCRFGTKRKWISFSVVTARGWRHTKYVTHYSWLLTLRHPFTDCNAHVKTFPFVNYFPW